MAIDFDENEVTEHYVNEERRDHEINPPLDVEKLIELEAAATKAPWGIYALSPTFVCGGEPKQHILQAAEMGDRYFITALRNAAPEIFKELKELRERYDQLLPLYNRVGKADASEIVVNKQKFYEGVRELRELRAWKENAEEYLRELQIDRKDALHGYDERYARKYGDLDQLLAPAAVEGE